MKSRFKGLYARAFCHATEDLDKVRLAVSNVIGSKTAELRNAEGVHGNPITIVEASLLDPDSIAGFLSRLGDSDLQGLLQTLEKRVDEGCNLFIKVDKQSAFKGQVRLGSGDDVISIRLRIEAFPAKCEVAQRHVREALGQELLRRRGSGVQ